MTEENIFSYPEFVRSLFKLDTLPMMYIHAAMGIAGEVAELCSSIFDSGIHSDHTREEMGDLLFYCQAALNFSHRSFVDYLDYRPALDDAAMVKSAGDLLDTVKRYAVYGKPLNEEMFTASVLSILGNLFALIDEARFTPQSIMRENVKKLQARYPAGTYSDADAVARRDKMENTAP